MIDPLTEAVEALTKIRNDAYVLSKHYHPTPGDMWLQAYGDNPESTRTTTRLELYANPDTKEGTEKGNE
jgi:hypothetical protein